MEPISVLVTDDEKAVRTAIKAALSAEGMSVTTSGSAEEALDLLSRRSFDIVLLDILMPGADGFSLLESIRDMGIFVPIIVLSGLGEDASMIKGYGLGADDYITKPFSTAVLVSKIKALLRRNKKYSVESHFLVSEISCGDFVLKPDIQKAFRKGKEISLSSKEFSILCKLMERPGEIISKEELFRDVWGKGEFDRTKMLVYIKRIRDKIESDPSEPAHLMTAWGKGYYFAP